VSKGRKLIDSLPELPLEPFEVAGKLGRSRRGPFLTILPPARPAPTPPKVVALPHQPLKASFFTNTFFAQALYPRVICHEFGSDVFEDFALDPVPDDGGGGPGPGSVVDRHADLMVLARHERHYKLSALNGTRLALPFWCTVKHGPWLCSVKETESCITGAPSTWELIVLDIPEISMVWFGEWLDQPTLPNLTVIKGNLAPHNSVPSCCPGHKLCFNTMSCIPNAVPCDPPIPV
jgi:hypothetical protein